WLYVLALRRQDRQTSGLIELALRPFPQRWRGAGGFQLSRAGVHRHEQIAASYPRIGQLRCLSLGAAEQLLRASNVSGRSPGMRSPKFVAALFLLLISCAVASFGAKLRQVAMVDLPGDPGFNQIAVANGQIVMTRPATNTIEIFSPVKRRVIARIS